jgi:hypothetical protein
MNKSEVIFLVGMPGSGKTIYLNTVIAREFKSGKLKIFDDYHADAKGGSDKFVDSKHYEDLERRIKKGKDSLISDIVYCDPVKLKNVANQIRSIAASFKCKVSIEFRYFKNDPEQCKRNVLNRTDRTPDQKDREKRLIDHFTTIYKIPSDITPIDVFEGRN